MRGSGFADTLLGSNNTGVEVFEGGPGDDLINGLGGFDRAVYEFILDDNVTSGIVVHLAAGTVAPIVSGDTSIGNDTLRSIESVRGTHFADTFDATGFTASSTNAGSAGVDSNGAAFNEFEGLGGNDTITGNGNTRISFINAADGVTVDLASPTPGVSGSPELLMGPHQMMSPVLVATQSWAASTASSVRFLRIRSLVATMARRALRFSMAGPAMILSMVAAASI